MNTGDFSVWNSDAALVQIGAGSGDFDVWLDGAPLVELGEGGAGGPITSRRRTWVAYYGSITLGPSYIFAKFTFENSSFAGWTTGPIVELLETLTFEDESLDAWSVGEMATAYFVQSFDFEDSDLSTWTLG